MGCLVSGSISLPSRGAFHLSLTVLVRYRWQSVFSLRRWSSQIPTGFLVSRGTRVSTEVRMALIVRGSHPLWRAVPGSFHKPIHNPFWLSCRKAEAQRPSSRCLPHTRNALVRSQLTPQPRRARPFGLGCSPFARRYLGYRVCFLFLRVLRCFSSPGALSYYGVTGHYTCRVAPFGNR